jgi:hypothetical protein
LISRAIIEIGWVPMDPLIFLSGKESD